MFCFTFVLDHNTDYIMLYSVQLKNMYSYLNTSLKLSDIVRGVSTVNNRIATYYHYTTHHHHSFYFILQTFTLSIHIMLSLIPSDANDPQGLMRR